MNSKIRNFIAAFVIQLVLSIPFYTASVYGLSISNVRVAKITPDKVTVQWDTDEIAKGKIRYGETNALGILRAHEEFVTSHQLILESGIKSDTNFFFVVDSTDQNGITVTENNSNDYYTFKTPDITAPPMVTGLKIDSFTLDTVSMSWDELSINDFEHYVVYRNMEQIANTTSTAFTDTDVVAKSGPKYRVSGVDTSGNEGPLSSIATLPEDAIDTTAPVISNINAISVTDTSAKVTWLTDEDSSSIVLYGLNKTDKSKASSGFVSNHSVVIDGLQKNVEYTLLVKSCDEAENCANASGGKIISLKDTTPPFINVTIPRFVNRKSIDIVGTTKPFSSLSLFINDMSIPKRSLSSREIGSSGRFAFSQIQLSQSNVIKLVAVDKSGNRNEKRFEVGVDTEQPIVRLDAIPSLVSKPNLTISGNTNEPVIVKVFIDTDANGTSVPSMITNLNATKISQNSVELQWDESKEKDFSHYVIYRNNEAIAIAKPANFNLFVDALADSGKTYTYEVTAVNIFANEGPKSEPLTVTTPRGGSVLNLKYALVDIFEDFRKPVFQTNVSNNFKFPIKLAKGDGIYKLKIIFEDKAENSVLFERSIKLDTEKPTIKITSPRSGTFIFENVANQIDVIGVTKPNARVHLFVDRTPFSFFNDTVEISGLPEELQELPESKLDAKCRSSVATSFCRTGADFSTDADAAGNFKFKNVDLTVIFGGASRIREVPLSDFKDTLLNQERRESITVSLLAIVTDVSGSRAFTKNDVKIGTCWSGNQSWDIIPLTQYQRPAFLSTERMAEGTEALRFYFNYTYIGPGKAARIQRVSIEKACGTRELLDSRFNISCQIMPSSNSPRLLNPPENTVSYSEMPISRFPGMDKFLEDDWKSFFKAINNELTFPMRIRITYQHDSDDDNQLETETQMTCEQVSYVVDNTLLDPRKVLPDWLLFNAVDFLQDSIKAMEKVQEQLNKVLEYAAIGCMASFALVLVVGAYRRYVVFADEYKFSFLNNAKKFTEAFSQMSNFFAQSPLQTQSNSNDEQQYCQDLVKQIANNKKRFSLKYVNDADLKKCFPTSSNAWKYEENVYAAMRWTCDRVFGHSSPSGWTENKNDGEILNKVSSAQTCGSDQAERGQPLRPQRCVDLAKQFNQLNGQKFNDDNICFRLETTSGIQTLDNFYMLGDPVESNLYRLITFEKISQNKIDFVKKITENTYLTASRKSCAELCGMTSSKTRKINWNVKEGEKTVTRPITVVKDPKDKNDKKVQRAATCVTVDECRSFNKNKELPDPDGGLGIAIQSAYSVGYSVKTSDIDPQPCFYTGAQDQGTKVVSDSPAEREECCCINSAGDIETHYYKFDDIDPITKNPDGSSKYVHESKLSQDALNPSPPKSYDDMKFSYRYYKDRFESRGIETDLSNLNTLEIGLPPPSSVRTSTLHYEYNPDRYISGRDQSACFGQNSWWDGGSENTVTVNPLREHLSAIQCVNIGGITARINALKNLMTFMSSCLIQVRTTGRADAGVCKELFTQYVCSSIWQALRWFIDGCSPTRDILDSNKLFPENNIIDYVKGGLRGTYQSLTDLQSTVSSEYGNAKLNEFLGLGEESLARKICLAAFGYDWPFNFKSFVDAAYSQPFATLVQPVTRSREFLSVEPQTFRPQYEYRASWLISPGCDFERYDVSLSCVGRKQLDKYPNNINCGAISSPSIGYTVPVTASPGTNIGPVRLGPGIGFAQCDCIGLPDEKVSSPVWSGRLKQNNLEDRAIPAGKRVLTDNYRYDHLKFKLRADRKITGNLKTNCFPTGYDEGEFYFPLIDKTGRDILDCHLDPASGSFVCSGGDIFGSKKGTANILSILINGNNPNNLDALTFFPGDSITIDTEIRNVGAQKCLRITLDGVPEYERIDEGIHQYSLTHPKTLTIGRSQFITPVVGINIKEINLANAEEDQLQVRFFDTFPIDKPGDDLIRFDQDMMTINGELIDGESLSNNPKTVQLGTAREVEVSIVDGNLRLKTKKGAEVEITDAQIQKKSDGISIEKPGITAEKVPDELKDRYENLKKGGPYGSVGGTFRILSPTKAQEQAQNTQSQPKSLVIELFNMKDNADALTFPESCNPNDAVRTTSGTPVKKSISIKVESKPITTRGIPLPKPSKPNLDPVIYKDVSKPITISSIISPSSLIGKAELECSRPDATKINVVQNTPVEKDKYEFNIGSSEITFAGTYWCTITTEGKNARNTPSSQTFSFNVACGPDNGQYGNCVSITGLCQNANRDFINTQNGLKCYITPAPDPEI